MTKLAFIINQNLLFFIGFLIFMMTGSVLLLTVGNHASFLLLNSYHCFFLNNFFRYYTFLGNGIFVILLGVLYIFWIKREEEGMAIICSFLLSGLIAQIIKHLVNFPRPKSFFGNGYHDYFISGIDYAFNNSFPSGHTATAFATATVITLTMKNKKWQVPVLLFASLLGFSRIYLGQHFLLDVIVGALVGTICGVACVYILSNYQYSKSISHSSVTSPSSI